ncbi:MAG TPA: hypothetical protein PLB02_00440 [Thermoanaerobaculia bacterium]|nr:hypothetical protein [Thermoanaerobaculia bacterium]
MKPADGNTRIHPTRIAALLEGTLDPADLQPGEAVEVAAKLAAAQARLVARGFDRVASRDEADAEDRLLKAPEAAARLGSTTDWVYRNWKRLPFTVSLGKGQLRFSERGLGKFIAAQQRGGGLK